MRGLLLIPALIAAVALAQLVHDPRPANADSMRNWFTLPTSAMSTRSGLYRSSTRQEPDGPEPPALDR